MLELEFGEIRVSPMVEVRGRLGERTEGLDSSTCMPYHLAWVPTRGNSGPSRSQMMNTAGEKMIWVQSSSVTFAWVCGFQKHSIIDCNIGFPGTQWWDIQVLYHISACSVRSGKVSVEDKTPRLL